MPSSQSSTTRLIADIGGTNARFALLEGYDCKEELVLACADYPDLVAAAEDFLQKVGAHQGARRPVEGSMAIAGPITGDVIRMTNHVWQWSAAQTRQRLKLDRLIVSQEPVERKLLWNGREALPVPDET